MLYKEYGNTGIMVSAIGMGGMRFKQEEYADGDLGRCAELVHMASSRGVNYFDTAPGYCNDKSEYIFGEAFRSMKRDSFYVSTKCGLWSVKDAGEVRGLIERSLERLHVEYIDFYNLWSIKTLEEYNQFMKTGGIYEQIVRAKEDGLIRHICFTTHMHSRDIAHVIDSGLFEGVTLGYNAINFAYRQEGVDAAYRAKMGVVTMNPLGGGMIPENPEYFSFLRRGGDSLAVSALKFIVSQPQVTVALCGFASEKEIDENIKACENLYDMSEKYLEDMSRHLSEGMNKLCTSCGYCDSCPAGVPIPMLMESYNQAILSGGKMQRVFDRLGGHWGLERSAAAACVKCGRCETLCTQKLPIMQRLDDIRPE